MSIIVKNARGQFHKVNSFTQVGPDECVVLKFTGPRHDKCAEMLLDYLDANPA